MQFLVRDFLNFEILNSFGSSAERCLNNEHFDKKITFYFATYDDFTTYSVVPYEQLKVG